ncbi:BUD22-domain-containing protein [Jimgerdemannia flammicorona]|uniref:BUD22-domain-containing protein n=2 Tax=Jimgerdemannia flammicorona TaxID=994334 RepID=A0A433Q769_9FUNG|nr:BUD22-domain-containing protein [Jimgerdemannia flammicorona]RUS25601.1 BUD22-domain-containing protein [Jimgerdemannia flammicorona]
MLKLSKPQLKKSTITHTGKPGSDDAESDEGERPKPDALFDNGVGDSDGASDPHNDGYDSDGEPITTKPKAKPIKANPSAAQLIKAKEKEKQERRKAWKEKEKARKAKEKAKKAGKGPMSMFVDTLYSGSESESEPDWDDPNFDKIYNGAGKDKKNRKGQRARRDEPLVNLFGIGPFLIFVHCHREWEKKYGPEAKHLKLAPPKRGFGARDGKSKYGRRSDRDAAPTLVAPTGANDMPLGARMGGNGAAGADAPALHPSWEAKRRQQQALAAVGFQGKKIVFGEEGEKREVEVKAKGGKGANGTNGAWGKGNKEKEELHPSWEAKRLQTEMMSAALSGWGGGGMNKKIVFNDSD